jgi:hypothetical protein
MDWGKLTEDQLDEVIVRAEGEIASWRAVQMAAIGEKRSRGSHRADGHRSIVDWVAARADVSHETARRICWTGSRLGEASEVSEQLASGEISFDRAEQLARLLREHRGGHEGYDIAQLRRLVAHHRRLTRKREKRITDNGYLNFATSFDEGSTSLWGELAGMDARIVEKAVDQRADELIPPDTRLAVAERRALALVAICQDSLYDTDLDTRSAPVEVTVTVDARSAAPTNGETGVSVLAGPRLGPSILEEVFCNGIVEVVGIAENGEPLNLGRRSRTVPPKLRRFVLGRDGGCTVEGCASRYRLEVHHNPPWSRGGETNDDDLITLCWYHHHIAVHREGFDILRIGTSRVRLKRPDRGGSSPPPRLRSPALSQVLARQSLRSTVQPCLDDDLLELVNLDSVQSDQHGGIPVEMRGGEEDVGIVAEQGLFDPEIGHPHSQDRAVGCALPKSLVVGAAQRSLPHETSALHPPLSRPSRRRLVRLGQAQGNAADVVPRGHGSETTRRLRHSVRRSARYFQSRANL